MKGISYNQYKQRMKALDELAWQNHRQNGRWLMFAIAVWLVIVITLVAIKFASN